MNNTYLFDNKLLTYYATRYFLRDCYYMSCRIIQSFYKSSFADRDFASLRLIYVIKHVFLLDMN
jgi:hypothetical protein